MSDTEQDRLRACKALHVELYNSFTYVRDVDQFLIPEHWWSHAPAFLQGKRWQDDCDGFAMTALDVAIEKGLALPEEVALHVCLTDLVSGQPYDHCVGSIDIGGVTYLFDNMGGHRLNLMSDRPYQFYSHKRYRGDGWHRTVIS